MNEIVLFLSLLLFGSGVCSIALGESWKWKQLIRGWSKNVVFLSPFQMEGTDT